MASKEPLATEKQLRHPVTMANKKKLLAALEASLGVITVAARTSGVARSLHHKYMTNDPAYAEKVREIEEVAIDFAESQLHNQIRNGNTTATIFYLKTKGKKRGYIEQQNLDVTSKGQSLAGEPEVDWSSVSPEALEELRQAKLIQLEND